MYLRMSATRQRGVSLLIMSFSLVLLMGWMSLYLIAAQQENMYMAALERRSVISYWERARYQACLKETGDMDTCGYLEVSE